MKKIFALISCAILLSGCTATSKPNTYNINEKGIFWTKHGTSFNNYRNINIPIKKADSASFKVLNNSKFAVDSKRVYFEGKELAKAQPASFKLVDDRYAKDAEMVYYRGKPIPLANSNSFTVIDDKFAKDMQRLYYNGLPLSGSSPDNYEIIYNGEFHFYIRSGSTLYYGNKIVPVCDIDTIQVHEIANRAKDSKCAYYYGKTLPKAEMDSFVVVKGSFAKDRYRVYFGREIIKGADAASFIYDENKKYRDKYSCFSGAQRKNCKDGSDFSLSSLRTEKDMDRAAQKLVGSWLKQDVQKAESQLKKLGATQQAIVQSLKGDLLTVKLSQKIDYSSLTENFHIQLTPTLESLFRDKRLFYQYTKTDKGIEVSILEERKNRVTQEKYKDNGQQMSSMRLPYLTYHDKTFPQGNCRFKIGVCQFEQATPTGSSFRTITTSYTGGVWMTEEINHNNHQVIHYFIFDKKGLPVYFAKVSNNALEEEYTRAYVGL